MIPDASKITLTEAANQVLVRQLDRVTDRLQKAAGSSKKRRKKSVHQLRVAVRRSVSAITVFKDVLPAEDASFVQRELRRVRRAAGQARDLDVLEQRLMKRFQKRATKALFFAIKNSRIQRKAAQQPIVDAYERFNARRVRRHVQSLIDGIAWNGRNGEPEFAPVMQQRLHRLSNKLSLCSRNLDEIEQLHRLRICGKRMRYTVEFMEEVQPGTIAPVAVSLLVDLQTKLGEVNDHATAIDLFGKWSKRQESKARRAAFRKLEKYEHKQTTRKTHAFQLWWTPIQVATLQRLLAVHGC